VADNDHAGAKEWHVRGYFTRLVVADVAEATDLAAQAMEYGAVVSQDEHVVSILWPEMEADESEHWEEYAFTELIFWLRAWAADNPRRDITILDERPVDVDEEQTVRRAS
jgi:hypothetical protein